MFNSAQAALLAPFLSKLAMSTMAILQNQPKLTDIKTA